MTRSRDASSRRRKTVLNRRLSRHSPPTRSYASARGSFERASIRGVSGRVLARKSPAARPDRISGRREPRRREKHSDEARRRTKKQVWWVEPAERSNAHDSPRSYQYIVFEVCQGDKICVRR